jgi:transcriptional regulator with XRE-family HTH domain
MAKVLSSEQVIGLLKKRQGRRPNTELAVELGISKQYLGDVLRGRRDPGPPILKALGIKRVFVLEKVS